MKEIMGLKSDQIFVDIGHGAGNAPLQAAYTIGCDARGLEIDVSRHTIAVLLDETLRSRYQSMVEKDNKVLWWSWFALFT
jgi:precorrin-6B methylase 2